MEPVWLTLLTIVASIVASGGFWSFIQKRDNLKSASTQLLMGLAHDRIISLGMGFIEKGWVGKDEYEDFLKYLYDPYSEFGGNGLAEKVAREVASLPMYSKQRPEVINISEVRHHDPR